MKRTRQILSVTLQRRAVSLDARILDLIVTCFSWLVCYHSPEICSGARRNPEVAVGGGFLDAIIHPDVPDREPTCGVLGLAFCGDTVRADSLVIPVSVTTAAEVESRIVQVLFR